MQLLPNIISKIYQAIHRYPYRAKPLKDRQKSDILTGKQKPLFRGVKNYAVAQAKV